MMMKTRAAVCAACIALVLCSCGNPILVDMFGGWKKRDPGVSAPFSVTVNGGAVTWHAAFDDAWVAANAANQTSTITLYANAAATTANCTISAANTGITIVGSGAERTISGTRFTVNNASAKFTLGNNIKVQGSSSATAALVTVTSGDFELLAGGTITGNANSNSNSSETGGGVHIDTNGIFTMYGGTISGNTSPAGGGVYNYSGTFTMHDGTISGNAAVINSSMSSFGGGVANYGNFTMNGGTISGNSSGGSGGGNGGGVWVNGIFTYNVSGGVGANTATFDGNRIYKTTAGTVTGSAVASLTLGSGSGANVSGTIAWWD